MKQRRKHFQNPKSGLFVKGGGGLPAAKAMKEIIGTMQVPSCNDRKSSI